MKSLNYLRLFIFIFSYCFLTNLNGSNISLGEGFDFSSFGGAGADGLMAPPTEEELKQIEDFLQTLSEDDLKELADIGKQIMETAEQKGVPVFSPAPISQPEQIPSKKSSERKKEKEKQDTKEEKKTDTNTIKFKKNIQKLIDIVISIRKQAATEEEFNDEISPFDNNLNNLVYYLHVIDDEKILKHILEKDFDKLRTNLENLTNDLEKYNAVFNVPISTTLEPENSYDRKKHANLLQKAQDVFDSITTLFTKIFTQDLIIEELEKVLKKYEPDALKIKEEEEEKQKKAKDFTKKIENSPTNSRGNNYYSPYSNDYYASLAGQPIPPSSINLPITDVIKKKLPNQPELTTKLLAHSEKGTKPNKTSKAETTNESKKNISINTTPSLQELEKSIPHYLASVEEFLNPKFETIISFLDGYKQDPTEGILTPTLRELTFRLDKAKKEISKWTALLDKETNFNQFNNSKQKMKDLLTDNNNFSTIKELHKKTKKTSNLKDNLKHFHSMMNFIEDKCC